MVVFNSYVKLPEGIIIAQIEDDGRMCVGISSFDLTLLCS